MTCHLLEGYHFLSIYYIEQIEKSKNTCWSLEKGIKYCISFKQYNQMSEDKHLPNISIYNGINPKVSGNPPRCHLFAHCFYQFKFYRKCRKIGDDLRAFTIVDFRGRKTFKSSSIIFCLLFLNSLNLFPGVPFCPFLYCTSVYRPASPRHQFVPIVRCQDVSASIQSFKIV